MVDGPRVVCGSIVLINGRRSGFGLKILAITAGLGANWLSVHVCLPTLLTDKQTQTVRKADRWYYWLFSCKLFERYNTQWILIPCGHSPAVQRGYSVFK